MGLELSYIYGQTPISEEEKEGLLIKTISIRSELDEFEQQNIEYAIEWTLKQNFSVDKILNQLAGLVTLGREGQHDDRHRQRDRWSDGLERKYYELVYRTGHVLTTT